MSDHLYIIFLMQRIDVRSNKEPMWLSMAFVRSFLKIYNHLCVVASAWCKNKPAKAPLFASLNLFICEILLRSFMW